MPYAARLLLQREYAVANPGGRCWWRLARVPHASSPPSCPLPCSPAHRGIGLGVLSRALAGLLDICPVLVILGLKSRDTVLVPGDPQRTIRGMNRGLGSVVPLFLASRKNTRTTDMASFSFVSDAP